MKIYKAKDYDELSRKAASIIASQVLMKPECVLGLATGSTPIGTYTLHTAMRARPARPCSRWLIS